MGFPLAQLSHYDGEHIVWLKPEDYAQFCAGKIVKHCHIPRQHVVVLPIPSKPSFMGTDGREDVDYILDHSRMGFRLDDTSVREEFENTSLRNALEQMAQNMAENIPPVCLAAVIEQSHPFTVWEDDITEEFINTMKHQNQFSGRATICGCGIPDCSSELAYIKADVCLLYVRVISAGWRMLELLPFRIDRTMPADTKNYVRRPAHVIITTRTRPLPLP